MSDESPLAILLKQRREALGMNPREFAEAISAAGGQATTQAVQQWENTTPGQRTTRPNFGNRRAIATVLGCDYGEIESAYRAARIADTSEDNEPPTVAPSNMRNRLGSKFQSRFEVEITGAIRASIPDADDYLDKIITPFGLKKRYDYLSPKLAVDWLWMRTPNLVMSSSPLEGHLWKLLWLSRLDSDTGVARKYLFIVIATTDDPDAIAAIRRRLDRLRDEARVFGNTLTLCFATSPAEAADLIVAHEKGRPIPAPASNPPEEIA